MKAIRIYITQKNIAAKAIALMDDHGVKTAWGEMDDSPGQIAERVRDFNPDAMIVRKGKITKEVLESAPNLKVIAKHGVGVDSIDLDAATERGIPVVITANANFESVAEHAFGLMLSLLRNIPASIQHTQQGGWDKTGFKAEELLGKTLGLIGFGRIGARLSEFVAPFRVKVLTFDPYLKKEDVPVGVSLVDDIDLIYANVDILSLHCPLTKTTMGLLNEAAFSKMKKGVILINTARGPLIREYDLVQALEAGQVSGAGLDTLIQEPPEKNNPLLNRSDVIVTQHVGGSSRQALINMGAQSVETILSMMKGQAPDLALLANKEVLEAHSSAV